MTKDSVIPQLQFLSALYIGGNELLNTQVLETMANNNPTYIPHSYKQLMSVIEYWLFISREDNVIIFTRK